MPCSRYLCTYWKCHFLSRKTNKIRKTALYPAIQGICGIRWTGGLCAGHHSAVDLKMNDLFHRSKSERLPTSDLLLWNKSVYLKVQTNMRYRIFECTFNIHCFAKTRAILNCFWSSIGWLFWLKVDRARNNIMQVTKAIAQKDSQMCLTLKVNCYGMGCDWYHARVPWVLYIVSSQVRHFFPSFHCESLWVGRLK